IEMKKLLNLIFLLLLFSCSANNAPQKNIEETILKFDSKLGLLQKSYRLWNEQTTGEFESLLDFKTFSSLSRLENAISYSLSCQDTIKSKAMGIQEMLVEYGNELKSFILKQDAKNKFEVQWLETREDIIKTMHYDVEAINIYLKLFLFMKKQFNYYEIEDATILFENEDILQEYNNHIEELDNCTEITVKQTELRAKVLKEYTQLINSIKNNKD
ncbi:MAG: hypothetical protein ACP5DQ_12255, partial [Bacteroidales bacterium]